MIFPCPETMALPRVQPSDSIQPSDSHLMKLQMENEMHGSIVGRRAFLQAGAIFMAGGVWQPGSRSWLQAAPAEQSVDIRIGLLTDLHYADKPTRGNRYYRESLPKLNEAVAAFQNAQIEFAVELGDLIDSASSLQEEQGFLKSINAPLAKAIPHRHYVLGNHCVERLTKEEFLGEVEQARSYYAFDHRGYHIIILDACFRGDGVPYGRKNSDWKDAFIPPEELDWLKEDLRGTSLPTLVFVHQRLDVNNHYAPRNATEVRKVLESSRKVVAVFQGHSHANDYHEINGIHYCTLAAMIEGAAPEHNSYSILKIHTDGALQVTGFRKQANYNWKSAVAD